MNPHLKKKLQRAKKKLDGKNSIHSGSGNLSVSKNKSAHSAPIFKKSEGKQALSQGTPKTDFATGRTLFPVDVGNGKIQYLPSKKDATPGEQRLGIFVADKSITKAPANSLDKQGKIVTEFATGRTLFATQDRYGKTQYLPSKSEASAKELSSGKYVPDKAVKIKSVNTLKPGGKMVKDVTSGRALFATTNSKGETQYLPARKDATPKELARGKFVSNKDIKQDPLNPLKMPKKTVTDVASDRTLFATTREVDGKVEYLPKYSEASGLERASGMYVMDFDVAENPKDNDLLEQAPEIDTDNNDRKVYPTRDEEGDIEYLPLKSEATDEELADGEYIDNEDFIAFQEAISKANVNDAVSSQLEQAQSEQNKISTLNTPEDINTLSEQVDDTAPGRLSNDNERAVDLDTGIEINGEATPEQPPISADTIEEGNNTYE
ncbi:hypothetical protein [Pseudoalteromonas sp. S16_S37]|uniref:hypothetical protein n=1 Tax=Pseudoalteromonas sp. S16_S37 TaxID=2720228 RepID=UPI0016805064|nr:hypothetical protein [Pseudoalteromonas sp. S16_S37]MBD1584499.1 hypothetical protein [Pseudoalteromonas sp. S16_S37]